MVYITTNQREGGSSYFLEFQIAKTPPHKEPVDLKKVVGTTSTFSFDIDPEIPLSRFRRTSLIGNMHCVVNNKLSWPPRKGTEPHRQQHALCCEEQALVASKERHGTS